MSSYIIYADGACLGNGSAFARAGWGATLTNPQGDTLDIAGPVADGEPQTNGRAELQAALEALRRCSKPVPITVYTDSELVAKGCNEWLPGWKARGWKKADKKAPEHLDLWKLLDLEMQTKDIRIEWVKAHSGIPGNERADRLAGIGATGKRIYKLTRKAVEATG